MNPTAAGTPSRRRAAPARLPSYALYGEPGGPPPALLHIESIAARSRRHQWEIKSHVHRGLHQVIWVRSGRVAALIDEMRAECDAPAMVLVPPAVAHAFRFSPQCEGFVLTLDAARVGEGDGLVLAEAWHTLFAQARSIALRSAPEEADRAQRLFEALHAEAALADSPALAWLSRALVWTLATLARQGVGQHAERGAVPAAYTRWLVLVEAHHLEHWPVSRYAQRLGMSTERLNRMLQSQTGQTAQRLLHQRLLREACRRLVHVAAPVSRLGYELGFEDPAYFCRFFKRHTGCSPRAYRQQALAQPRAGPARTAA